MLIFELVDTKEKQRVWGKKQFIEVQAVK